MNPISLKVKDFMCYGDAFLDFEKFDSALIIGKTNDNFNISNGSGKSSLFGAIEYCLFGDFGDLKLDKVVREGQVQCQVEFVFSINNDKYKIFRSRSSKGSPNVQLFQEINDSWKDVSGRRNSDTENQINKIIKINSKSFRNSTHFVQRDLSGITNLKPTERKKVLKEIFDLSIYSKLEKNAKDKLSSFNKEFIKITSLLESYGDPNNDILLFNNDLKSLNINLNDLIIEYNSKNNKYKELSSEKQILSIELKNTLSNLPSLLEKEKSLKSKKDNLENLIQSSKSELSFLELQINKINDDISKINKIDEALDEKISLIKSNIEKYYLQASKIETEISALKKEKLKLQKLENASKCDSCEQEITGLRSDSIKLRLVDINSLISDLDFKNESLMKKFFIDKEAESDLNIAKQKQDLDIKGLNLFNSKLNNLNISLSKGLLNSKNYEDNLENINSELNLILLEKEKYSIDNINNIKLKITNLSSEVQSLEKDLNSLNNNITNAKNKIAITENNIKQKQELIEKIKDYSKKLEDLSEEIKIYELIVNAFSSSGIPSFIINNLLNDIQTKANEFCEKIKPGLQIEFVLSKENSQGQEVDTLDIRYFYNNKERDFNQLSGAMKFNVTFSIKLALSIIIQEILETEIKFFLFDEIDSSLDVFSSNEFINVVKELQKDYKILLITHGDSLKDKFNTKIIVDQNSDGISTIIQN